MNKCSRFFLVLLLSLTGIGASQEKVAIIFGVTGQDGSYLAEHLLEKGYIVHGVKRRSSSFNTERIDHLYHDKHEEDLRFFLHYGDVIDGAHIEHLIRDLQPDEVYNLAAQSHVRVSFDLPSYTCHVNALGTLNILEAIRNNRCEKKIKFYQASTSEMYGGVRDQILSEATPFYPRSPYAAAKLCAHALTVNYREAYGIFACSGILFNHESPRRGRTFVTKKIVDGLVRIKLGLQEILFLGNLDARRDWGFAKDYVEAMALMLEHESPDDYVIATGEDHSVREFIHECCSYLDIDLVWQGSLVDEKGIDAKTGKVMIAIDPVYFRPSEVNVLKGDASKAKQVLGWEPKTSFTDLVKIMIDDEMELVQKKI